MGDAHSIKPGSICHVEIPGPDLEKMQAFYGAVFGWEFSPMGPTYVLFSDGVAGGGIDAEAPVGDGGAVLVIAVDDIDAKIDTIREAGGEQLSPKTVISEDHGCYAYFRDPCGNKMGVWSKT